MSKIHINSNGEPGVCKAQKGGCPFGDEDSHFTNAQDASAAYESAQKAMSNGIHQRSVNKDGEWDDRNFAEVTTREDALRVANIIVNEGKYAGIVKIETAYGSHPDPDDFDDEDDYEEARAEYVDGFPEESEVRHSETTYYVRGFDNWEDRNKFSNDAWLPSVTYSDEVDLNLDGEPGDDYSEQRGTDDSTNDRWWNIDMEFKAPKSHVSAEA